MVVERPALVDFARIAQDCFYRQDWPAKELLVFNTTGIPIKRWWHRRTREIRLRRMPRAQMLHVLRENATGEWCILWDADCWYHKSVIRQHMQAAERETTVLFRHTTAYSVADKQAFNISDDRIQHGSFLRMAKIDFTKPFYRQTPRLKLVDAPAHMVVKFVSRIYDS